MEDLLQKRIELITHLLDEKKAQDITVFDLKGCEYITDSVVIATAMAGKHSYALLDHLKTELKKNGEVFYSEDWLIADLGEIIVHIFTENTRKRFNLEEFLRQQFLHYKI